jgi:hypothetical protein
MSLRRLEIVEGEGAKDEGIDGSDAKGLSRGQRGHRISAESMRTRISMMR